MGQLFTEVTHLSLLNLWPGVRLCRGKLPAALSRLFTTLNWGKWGDKFGFVILHLGYTSHNRRVHSGRVDIAQLILDVVSPNFQ